MTYLNSTRQELRGAGSYYGSDSYGMGAGQSGPYQAYEQQLLQYISQVKGYLGSMQQGTQAYTQVQNYLSTANSYLQQYFPNDAMSGDLGGGTNWDPTAGAYPGAGSTGTPGNGTEPAAQYGEMIWQDSTKVKWDGADPVVYGVSQQSDSRQQDFFQSDVTIQIPYNGAKAKAELVADDSVAGAQMLKVTITMPDGSTRIECVHNVTAKSNIHLQSVDPANITLDASVTSSAVAGQITAEDISDPTTTQSQGDQPTKRSDGKMGYDGSSFEIYPQGDGKDYSVSARNGVNFHAGSNSEYWSVAWDNTANQYVIKVYNDAAHTKVLNTYHVDDMTNLKMTFDIDPTHIEFLGSLAGSYQNTSNGQTGSASSMANDHTINTNDPHGKKLSLVGDGNNTSNENGVDPANVTPADNITNGTATYNNSPNGNVDVNAFFGDGYIQNYDITAPGQVTIHKTNYSDTAVITKNANGTYTIAVTSGDDPTKKTTFTVKGPPSNLELDFLPANVKYKDLSKTPSVSTETPYTPGALGAGVKVDGEGSITQNNQDTANQAADKILGQLKWNTNKTEEQIISKVKELYPELATYDADNDGKLSKEEFAKAVQDQAFPPANPDGRLFHLLSDLDPTLAVDLSSLIPAKIFNGTVSSPIVRDRLVTLLNSFYPGRVTPGTQPDTIKFDGQDHNVINLNADISGGLWNLLQGW